jgi:DNA-binding transcriptional MerR regulator
MASADNVISAFSEQHVERLTRLSKAQLRYWDRTGFFPPEYAAGEARSPYGRVYSFRNVVALRTLSTLRNVHKVSLQHLRQVAEELSHMKDTLWTQTTLYVAKRRVHVVLGRGRPPIDPTTGQYALESIALKAVITDVKRESESLRGRDPSTVGNVTRSRFVSHNAWVVAGTRITTRAIKNFSESGYSVAAILEEYPDLSPADVEAALAHQEGPAKVAA